MSTRQLSPYEKNHLRKYGFDPENIAGYGAAPVEYITGKVVFAGHEFVVSSDTLIPRVETEELVEYIQRAIFLENGDQKLHIADIGTGSGVIGLSLAKFLESQHRAFEITLIDVSQKALQVAEINSQHLFPQAPLLGSFTFLHGNLLDEVPSEAKFHFIVANLPYIPTARMVDLDDSVKDFEPHLALDGGPDGLTHIARLLHQAREYIYPSGSLYLEIDDTHTAKTLKPLAQGFSLEVIQDQFGKNRFALLKKQ